MHAPTNKTFLLLIDMLSEWLEASRSCQVLCTACIFKQKRVSCASNAHSDDKLAFVLKVFEVIDLIGGRDNILKLT